MARRQHSSDVQTARGASWVWGLAVIGMCLGALWWLTSQQRADTAGRAPDPVVEAMGGSSDSSFSLSGTADQADVSPPALEQAEAEVSRLSAQLRSELDAYETALKKQDKQLAEADARIEKHASLLRKIDELEKAYSERRITIEEYLLQRESIAKEVVGSAE